MIRPKPQRAPKAEIETSVQGSISQISLDTERAGVLTLLDMEESCAELSRHTGGYYWIVIFFAKLLTLSDADHGFRHGENSAIRALFCGSFGRFISTSVPNPNGKMMIFFSIF